MADEDGLLLFGWEKQFTLLSEKWKEMDIASRVPQVVWRGRTEDKEYPKRDELMSKWQHIQPSGPCTYDHACSVSLICCIISNRDVTAYVSAGGNLHDVGTSCGGKGLKRKRSFSASGSQKSSCTILETTGDGVPSNPSM